MKCAGPVTSVASVSEHDAKVAASPGRFEFRIVAAPTEHRAPRACRAAKETTGQWSQSELATSWASAPWWADGSVVVSRRPLRDATTEPSAHHGADAHDVASSLWLHCPVVSLAARHARGALCSVGAATMRN